MRVPHLHHRSRRLASFFFKFTAFFGWRRTDTAISFRTLASVARFHGTASIRGLIGEPISKLTLFCCWAVNLSTNLLAFTSTPTEGATTPPAVQAIHRSKRWRPDYEQSQSATVRIGLKLQVTHASAWIPWPPEQALVILMPMQQLLRDRTSFCCNPEFSL